MRIEELLPWTRTPLVINAPMGGFAGAELAIAVSKAGGLGQIGGTPDLQDLDTQLSRAQEALDLDDGLLPVGVGLLLFAMNAHESIAVLEKYRPAVVWLFAAKDLSDYSQWAQKIRKALPKTQVWIQVGSVQAALTITNGTKPTVLSIQGSDAGGHGFERGASIVSLLPEVADALAAAGHGDIALVAAGGIADGRAAAAALVLGAQGVVLGTRFLSAPETNVHPTYRAAVIAAKDGGQSTVRAKVFDELRGPNQWPVEYDGRSIRTESFRDHQAGVHLDEIRRRYAEASQSPSNGFARDGGGRAATWAGTGVGLIKQEQAAAAIVNEVRSGILQALQDVRARLS